MKTRLSLVVLLVNLCVSTVFAAPIRIALLDFEDQTGQKAEDLLGGKIDVTKLVEKGPLLLAKNLVNVEGYDLVDRRDFVAAINRATAGTGEGETGGRAAFIQPAQYLNANVVLRGSLMSLSSSKKVVDLGGHHSEHTELTVRLALEALDVHNGSVLALSESSAKQSFRQTSGHYTEIGESDVLDMLESSLVDALADMKSQLGEKLSNLSAKQTVKLSVSATENPALVEIDGILVGSTPFTELEVYAGDHLFRVTRPGYDPISKRIMVQKNLNIEVPMFRSDLDAHEKKEVLEKAETHVYMGEEVPFLIQEVD